MSTTPPVTKRTIAEFWTFGDTNIRVLLERGDKEHNCVFLDEVFQGNTLASLWVSDEEVLDRLIEALQKARAVIREESQK